MLGAEERCHILFGLKWKIHRAVHMEISPQAVWGSQKHLIHEKLGKAHWSRVCSVINHLSGAFAAFQSHEKHQTADLKSIPAAGLSGWPVQLRPFPFKVERGSFSLRAGCTSPLHQEREPAVWWHFLQQRSMSLKCGWEFHFVDSDFSWECLQNASPSVWWAGEKSCQALLIPSKSHRSAHSRPVFLFLAAALCVKWWKVSSLELNTNSDRRRRLVHDLNKISALSFSLHRVPNGSFCLFKAQWKVEVWIRPRSRW